MNLEKAKPGVYIKVGGADRRLVFDMVALSVIEEDKDDQNWLQKAVRKPSFGVIAYLVWAGLLRDYPELDSPDRMERRAKQRQVSDWCEALETDIEDVAKNLFRALENSTPLRRARAKGEVDAAGSETPKPVKE